MSYSDDEYVSAAIRRRRRSPPTHLYRKWNAGDDFVALFGATFTASTIRRYIDVNGLVQTAAINELRSAHYIGSVRTMLIEPARTNIVTRKRDLANAAWVKVNMTAVRDQTGPDGVASSASSITATGAAATILLTLVNGSSARFQSAWVKRITGVGTLEMTMDNGAAWTVVTPVGALWQRVSIPTQTIANPVVGFRVATSGDAFAIDFVQNEGGVYRTSEIAITETGADQRTQDLLTFPITFTPQQFNVYAKVYNYGSANEVAGSERVITFGSGTGRFLIRAESAGGKCLTAVTVNSAGTTAATGPNVTAAVGDAIEAVGSLISTGRAQIQLSLNGATTQLGTQSAVNALSNNWGTLAAHVAGDGTTTGTWAFTSLKILLGKLRSLDSMRTL